MNHIIPDHPWSTNPQKAFKPSIVTLPEIQKPYPSILAFLASRFKNVPQNIWRQRIRLGSVKDENGTPITLDTPFVPNMRLLYFREVEDEPVIPFTETILFQNEHLIVSAKPHFLPVTPGGPYVNECLLYRLQNQTGLNDLSPIHRIDRATAGVVLFSVNRKTRGAYQTLFDTGQVTKIYEAIGGRPFETGKTRWTVEGNIEKGTPFFRMQDAPEPVNSKTVIHLVETKEDLARYRIHPHTGKKHQIRLHMCRICQGIQNDPYYPLLQSESAPDFTKPMKLLAKEISFTDPLTKKRLWISSPQTLSWD